jgi:hypothetical protein
VVFKRLYPDLSEIDRNFWGEISGLDSAVGRLREELRRLDIADNTLLWFVSDNGGISEASGIDRKGRIGSRTIALLEWPRTITRPMRTDIPVCHVDMYPTVLDIVGVTMLRLGLPTKRRKTESVTLYDILTDPGQEKDLAEQHPEEVRQMVADLAAWRESVQASFAGRDYLR